MTGYKIFEVRCRSFCSVPRPRHIGAAKKLGVTNIITRSIAPSCEIPGEPSIKKLNSAVVKQKKSRHQTPTLTFLPLYLLQGTDTICKMIKSL